ncbi:wax ester/triacylglycerol synthase family O-acyltransferase [Nocardia sp. NPDC057353]|uniref:WS/DGAT/MGAT family O-acyltransferase n=1 Tax=Nocardia sp. NPDC057353 TaxID=3346104 RepID=UPI00362EA107
MELIAPIDAVFLLAESREQPMHVGSVQIFEPPEGVGREFAQTIHAHLLDCDDVQPRFRKRPATIFGAPRAAWTYDDRADLSYHVRRVGLPTPGGRAELLDLVSGLHGALLDRHHPLWEFHLIEGLADGRFAMYSKMHHALIDGVTAQRLLQRTLALDPTEPGNVPWNVPRRTKDGEAKGGGVFGAARELVSMAAGPTLARLVGKTVLKQQVAMPFDAPRTMFNVPIAGARRIAARSWPLERLQQVRKATGATMNDVVLAMSAGAVRSYLLDHDALPDKPLIAMVPMSLRSPGEPDSDGVKVGAMLCNLGTDRTDPVARLQVISESMRASKAAYDSLSAIQAMAVSALMLSPLAVTLVPGLIPWTSPPFNLVISNVPGTRKPLYWNGARLDAAYPLSIPFDGQAMNITLAGTGDNLDFGLVACRRTVPDLERMLDHLETALKELEHATA